MRGIKEKSQGPICLVITRGNMRAMIDLNISVPVKNWDGKNQTVVGKFPSRESINLMLQEKKFEAMKIIDRLYEEDTLYDKTVAQIKDLVAKRMFPDKHNEDKAKGVLFIDHFRKFMSRKTGGTYSVYNQTLTKLLAYKEDIESLSFEEVTVKWLRDFEKFLMPTSPSRNARNIPLRHIRAVFNDAIDEELITCYPFRKFKIRPEATRKRSLSIEDLRKLFTMDVEGYAEIYRDMFKLIFMLIGINTVDLQSQINN